MRRFSVLVCACALAGCGGDASNNMPGDGGATGEAGESSVSGSSSGGSGSSGGVASSSGSGSGGGVASGSGAASSGGSGSGGAPASSGGSGSSGGVGSSGGAGSSSGSSSGAGSGAGDGGVPGLTWPNNVSFANSDPWLSNHHNDIQEVHPRVLVIHFANGKTMADVTKMFNDQKAALMEGSRYHGYSDPSAKPFLIWELAKLVDLTDAIVPPGWTAPNSTKLPRLNAQLDFGALFNQTYADYYAIPDPKNPSHNMTLCELLNAGIINEVRIAITKSGSDSNIAPEIVESKQMYDANDLAIPGKFDKNAGNGWWNGGDVPAAACGRSIRIGFLELNGILGNEMQVNGHNYEHLSRSLPHFGAMWMPFANFDMNTRYKTPFADWYGECSAGAGCITYPDQNSVMWHTATASGTISPFNQGCGSAHFPPNARGNYDQTETQTVLSTCEHYGMHDGPNGADIQTPYDVSKLAKWKAQYGISPVGGAWYMYWFESFPGLNNKAKMPDGTPMKNWWVYLYY